VEDATGVRVDRDGPVTVVTIDRPERRNAVDAAAAAALADAFRAFDRDPGASVAVLTGAGGAFCAGADLKAIAAGRPPRVAPDGDGPMGPTRLRLTKPVLAAIEAPGSWPAGSSWPSGATCGPPGRPPPWACSTAASGCR
jgi:enoyl-CoA hydratase